MKIGFFDSGLGGTTILKETIKLLPNEEYVYLADNLYVPYGKKETSYLKEIIISNIQRLVDEGSEIIVIACNTATSVAIKELRERFSVPIIGTEPALKPAIIYRKKQGDNNKKILVTATELTLKEQKLQDLIEELEAKDYIDKIALPKLVEYSENMIFDEEIILKSLGEAIKDKGKYESIVLGCTHFPIYKKEILKFFDNKIKIFDSSLGVAKEVEKIVEKNRFESRYINDKETSIDFLNTKNEKNYTEKFKNLIKRLDNF